MTARTTWMSCLCFVGLSGCLGRTQADLLQARLREQQQILAETQAQLDASAKELKLARKETEGLRHQLAKSGAPGLLPEQSDALVRVSAIRINSMLTAGFDRDDAYGDDSLVVQFTPVDDTGEVVRLPGEVRIRVVDPALPEDSQTVDEWTFSAAESRERWVRGFLGNGYQFTLPWQRPPKNSDLVVHVQLRPADGREFTATHLVKITPPVVTADAQQIQPAGAASLRKPELETPTRPVIEDSSRWMRDDVPTYR